jgi:hypothetical protein
MEGRREDEGLDEDDDDTSLSSIADDFGLTWSWRRFVLQGLIFSVCVFCLSTFEEDGL